MTNGDPQSEPVQHSAPDSQEVPFAWQPLTPRGVAAFATAPLRRLGFVQLVVAVLAASAMVSFLRNAWFPTVQEALRQLPAQGDIHRGQLDWRGASPTRVAEGIFLSFIVDLNRDGQAGRTAHVQVELGKTDCRICSLLGCVTLPYPKGWIVALNRTELEPGWGAWQPAILAAAFLLTLCGLMTTWWLLATLYTLPAWIIARYADRVSSLRQSWKLAAASLLPGAILLAVAIFSYGLNLIDPVRLGIAVILHFAIGWFYLFVCPLYHPRPTTGPKNRTNPFSGSPKRTETDGLGKDDR